jgi:circadian clock protein KaiB
MNMPENEIPPLDNSFQSGLVDLADAFEKAAVNPSEVKYVLTLYVTGMRPRSQQAIENVCRLCEEYLQGRYELQIIDIYQQPLLAQSAQIIAAPTLVKKLPPPLRQIIGDMSDDGRVLVAMGIKLPETPEQPAATAQNGSL